jgi:hypothetical protein
MFIDLGFAVFDAYNGYHALALLERLLWMSGCLA